MTSKPSQAHSISKPGDAQTLLVVRRRTTTLWTMTRIRASFPSNLSRLYHGISTRTPYLAEEGQQLICLDWLVRCSWLMMIMVSKAHVGLSAPGNA